MQDSTARTDSSTPAYRRLLQEPLLQFLVIGAVLFGVDAWLHPAAKDNRTIVVTKQMRDSIIETYDEDHSRKPTDAELQATIDNWVGDEMLYREGRLLGLDQGDPTIRDRIVYKLKVMLTDEAKPREPSEAELRAWFEKNHARYDEPARTTFLATAPVSEDVARKEYGDVKAQRESAELQQQTRVFLDRPTAATTAVFGADFAKTLDAAPVGQWQVIQSSAGWHLVRVDARKDGKLAALDDVRADVIKTWKAEQSLKATLEAMDRLKARYTVRYEP
jgi:PPIC-type PPIASE domain